MHVLPSTIAAVIMVVVCALRVIVVSPAKVVVERKNRAPCIAFVVHGIVRLSESDQTY